MPLKRGLALVWSLAVVVFTASGCEPRGGITPPPTDTTPPPPRDTIEVMVGAGDIANCRWDEDEQTAALIDTIAGTVFTLGDNAYDHGTPEDFANCYDPNWGRFRDRTRPVIGNHDYETAFAAGYFTYFGVSAGEPDEGYYSYDLGSWHVVVLNSNITSHATSAQVAWLRADLAATNKRCVIAMWHHPRFSSGQHGSWEAMRPFWEVLYEFGAEIVLNGHDHLYERFGPQTPAGAPDPDYGIRQFVVGTGGRSNYSFVGAEPNSEVRRTGTAGVLKLTLRNSTYSWQFIPVAGQTFTDTGDGTCHAPNPNPPPPPPPPASTVVLSAAGNIGDCSGSEDNDTGAILDTLPGYVLTLGDNAFPDGTLAEYNTCYEPAWGRHKGRTLAVLGNHEYNTGNADGSFDYFGSRAGPRGAGYYSTNLGSWHVVVLNDNGGFVSYAPGSLQDAWLQSDLANHQGMCTLVAFHQPMFLSSNTPGFTTRDRRTIWDRLWAAGVDVVLNGQQHHYERFAPMQPDGTRDDAQGIRQFNVGTGGESLVLPTVAIHPHSEVRAAQFGVLKLTLEPQRYSWTFIPISGAPVDSGSATCH